MKHTLLSVQHKDIIPAVTRVLAWSQKYMRERQVQCIVVVEVVTYCMVINRMSAVL